MVDFSKLTRHPARHCTQCNQSFQPIDNEKTLCIECEYFQENPHLAPKYWTWQRGKENEWRVTAWWPDNEPEPEPGLIVTVHRQNGTNSPQTLQEVVQNYVTPSGQRHIVCSIR